MLLLVGTPPRMTRSVSRRGEELLKAQRSSLYLASASHTPSSLPPVITRRSNVLDSACVSVTKSPPVLPSKPEPSDLFPVEQIEPLLETFLPPDPPLPDLPFKAPSPSEPPDPPLKLLLLCALQNLQILQMLIATKSGGGGGAPMSASDTFFACGLLSPVVKEKFIFIFSPMNMDVAVYDFPLVPRLNQSSFLIFPPIWSELDEQASLVLQGSSSHRMLFSASGGVCVVLRVTLDVIFEVAYDVVVILFHMPLITRYQTQLSVPLLTMDFSPWSLLGRYLYETLYSLQSATVAISVTYVGSDVSKQTSSETERASGTASNTHILLNGSRVRLLSIQNEWHRLSWSIQSSVEALGRPGTFIRDPDSIRDPIRIRSENPERPNPDPDRYPTPGYPRTPDPDKDSKIMDPPDKDPDPDILKLPGYPIRPRPSACNRAINRLLTKSPARCLTLGLVHSMNANYLTRSINKNV
ncbi:hypothetical protein DY000_02005230 [Brassica cretica]|uniref:Uncharacterized protein n=1 Tax=Brassica cretica TaxID=69181 RepID=A0ABQ7C6Z1_BRACR|nr:hypothetical protein DY000_02005230 [Brassica cretica]